MRPASLENMPTAKKLREMKKIEPISTNNKTFHRKFEEIGDKLPDISPKKAAAVLKSISITSPKIMLKNY